MTRRKDVIETRFNLTLEILLIDLNRYLDRGIRRDIVSISLLRFFWLISTYSHAARGVNVGFNLTLEILLIDLGIASSGSVSLFQFQSHSWDSSDWSRPRRVCISSSRTVSISLLRFFWLICCGFALWIKTLKRFNLTLEILLIDLAFAPPPSSRRNRVSISLLRFFWLIWKSSPGGSRCRCSFNLTLEILLIDLFRSGVSPVIHETSFNLTLEILLIDLLYPKPTGKPVFEVSISLLRFFWLIFSRRSLCCTRPCCFNLTLEILLIDLKMRSTRRSWRISFNLTLEILLIDLEDALAE